MSKTQTKTLKMIYKNQFKYIDCPKDADYEECIEIAIDLFNIQSKFKKFIQVTNDDGNIFDKHTFEYYNLIFPNPVIIFFIKIDYEKLKNQHPKKERKPLAELAIKRKRWNENKENLIPRKNCGDASLYEIERKESEEPAVKKHKTSFSSKPKTSWWHLIFNKLFD